MPTIKAKDIKDADDMLGSGVRKVALPENIDSDDFFRLASHWCERGAKVSLKEGRFVVSIKGMAIPPND
ncbi:MULTISPECIES: hypothetical protein [Erwinia]|uniref:hypothetical protein n=1 Tax=Erwinia TaxID=551 RepID=UPI0005587157|nr:MULTISPECIES: hypothetical protein [Erwinia]